jgi:hypothetical protein
MDFLKSLFSLKPAQQYNLQALSEVQPQGALRETHTHQWTERLTTYAPPRRGLVDNPTDNYMVLRQLLLGVTTVLFECVLCHTFQQLESLGSQKLQLDDLLDSVELYGPQYHQRNDITFVIQKYQPLQTQPVSALPLR